MHDLRVMAMAKPAPLVVPTRASAVAFTRPEAFDRWEPGIKAANDMGANVITIYDVDA